MKRRNFWIGCGMGFVILVVLLSVTPDPINAPSVDGFKVGHILAYAWLMFWFCAIYPRGSQRVAIGVALIVMGVALEYVQDMIGRDFAYSDMVDDAIGVFLGWVTAMTPLGRGLAFLDGRINAGGPT
jgi:VanZ family protein